jgi:tRNA G37 N-methylase Trm5
MQMTVPLVKQAHTKVAEYLHNGDIVIDATMGNGFDTLFLAQGVGDTGRVYAFDVQANAIESTQIRLAEEGVIDRVRLINDDHANLSAYLKDEHVAEIRCAMFNLGYLPGSDKAHQTNPESTIKSLDSAVSLLSKQGIVSILAYTGHTGGREEAERVKAWVMSLSKSQFDVSIKIPMSKSKSPPEWIVIESR